MKVEMGDFQTPRQWAKDLTTILIKKEKKPAIVIEPTCGMGAFVQAASELYPTAKVFGYDINLKYVELAKQKSSANSNVTIVCEDFFNGEFNSQLKKEFSHILFLGNPPWVTNSKQLCSGTVAMICKSSVARKILTYALNKKLKFCSAKFFPLNAKQVFNVSVDCGFFVFNSYAETDYNVEVLNLNFQLLGKYGHTNGRLVSDIESEEKANVDILQRLKLDSITNEVVGHYKSKVLNKNSQNLMFLDV
jgi:predicted RNA methylase